MPTIVHGSGGGITSTLLASLTSVPSSSTAVSGTENWKNYDAIYIECFMHYETNSDISVFTNIYIADSVSLGTRYQIFRSSSAISSGNNANAFVYFTDTAISVYKTISVYEVTKINIYGINF